MLFQFPRTPVKLHVDDLLAHDVLEASKVRRWLSVGQPQQFCRHDPVVRCLEK